MRFPVFLAVCVSFLLAAVGSAQFPSIPSTTSPKESNKGFQTPEEALRALLDGVRTNNYDLARKALDLTKLNFAVRDTEGARAAQMAVAIFNRSVGFDVDISANGSDSIGLSLKGEHMTRRRSIELAEVGDAGWKITSDSVAALPEIWAEMRDSVPVNKFPTDFESDLDNAQQLRSRFDSRLWREFLGIEIWQWICFGLLIALPWVASRLIRGVVSVPLRRKLGKEGVRSLLTLKSGIYWTVAGVSWLYALPYLDLPLNVAAPITLLTKVVIAFGLAKLGIGSVDLGVEIVGAHGHIRTKRAESVYLPILRNFARSVVILVVFWGLLAALDFNVNGLIAGLGISGLVLALAAKDSVENIFGSLTILFDMPFGIGDWVRIGNDIDGVVEEINLRSTRIRTFADSVVTVPNSNLTKAAVENMGARRQRRIDFQLALSRTDPAAAIAFAGKLMDAMRHHPMIREDNAYAYVTSITETGVAVSVKGYIRTNDYEEELKVRQELIALITKLAHDEGVEFAPLHLAALAGA